MRAVREVRWVQYSQLSRLRSHVCTVDGVFRFPIFLKTLNWRDGTGDNSSENSILVSQRWQRPLCDFMVQLDGPIGQSRLVEVRVLASTGPVLVVRGV